MTELRPDFYGEFSCKASACRHTCCHGWEIDIDEDTALYYLSLEGALGYELREALLFDGETYSFKLKGDGRCPFLRGDGLCRLILELGEDALSDICALHPRFFASFRGFELCGLGLACEKAAELLLSGRGRLGFLTESGERLSLDGIVGRKINIEPCL
ncbi:MAG: flagellin lysine-N-methylase, partial [Oscillospiraceae bacterium]|nr:flagellin lysine-N-methylase [Oscillospiraceae bacterium]